MKIAIGSSSLSKKSAVVKAFRIFDLRPQIVYSGGKRDATPPVGAKELITMAHDRATYSLRMASEAEYGIGIQWGVSSKRWGTPYLLSWVVIRARFGQEYHSHSGGYPVPDEFPDELKKGEHALKDLMRKHITFTDDPDPYHVFSSGAYSNEEVLMEAVRDALLQIPKIRAR
jgi:non-canonical (house-cleaning) NTP pyrophosphatase